MNSQVLGFGLSLLLAGLVGLILYIRERRIKARLGEGLRRLPVSEKRKLDLAKLALLMGIAAVWLLLYNFLNQHLGLPPGSPVPHIWFAVLLMYSLHRLNNIWIGTKGIAGADIPFTRWEDIERIDFDNDVRQREWGYLIRLKNGKVLKRYIARNRQAEFAGLVAGYVPLNQPAATAAEPASA